MKQVVFIGGGDSYSNHEDFLQALKTQAVRNPTGEASERWTTHIHESLGEAVTVFKIGMPNTENANYEEWKIWFERYFEFFNGPVVLLGWSLGGMFLLKYLKEETLPLEIEALIVLAAPAGEYDDGSGNDCGSFRFTLEGLDTIVEKVAKIAIFHSKDDFVVPYEHALRLKAALPLATLHTFEDRNHFLQPEFPELIEYLKSL